MKSQPKVRLSQLYQGGTRLVCLEDIYDFAVESGMSQKATSPNEWFASKTLTELLEKIPAQQYEQKIFTHYGKIYCTAALAFKYAVSIREDFAEELLSEIFTAKDILGCAVPTSVLVEVSNSKRAELSENSTKRLIKMIKLVSALEFKELYEEVFNEIHKHILGFRQSTIRSLLKKEDETFFSEKTGSVREFLTDNVSDLYIEAETAVADYLYKNCYKESKSFKRSNLARFLRRKAFSKRLFGNVGKIALLVKNSRSVQTQLWLHKDGTFSQIIVRKDF